MGRGKKEVGEERGRGREGVGERRGQGRGMGKKRLGKRGEARGEEGCEGRRGK